MVDVERERPVAAARVGQPASVVGDAPEGDGIDDVGIGAVKAEQILIDLRLLLELLLAETDNPDSEPWLGGTRSDLGLIARVYEELAGLLNMQQLELEKIMEDNFNRIVQKS